MDSASIARKTSAPAASASLSKICTDASDTRSTRDAGARFRGPPPGRRPDAGRRCREPPVPGTPNERRNPLVPLPVDPATLVDGLDAVLVTHLHADHFD